MFRKYLFLAKAISVSWYNKNKKIFSHNDHPLFHIHRTILRGVRRGEKALTYASPNATLI